MGSDGADPGAFLYMCPEFKPAGGGTPGEIGPRQLINSGQRCINQQRVFLNFSLRPPPQRVVKGEQERDVFRGFSLGSENRGERRAMPSAG